MVRTRDAPNIVFVFADQLRSHALSCYGNDQVNTPNIDRLASEGVKFTKAISTTPVCGPFRGMLMSGNFPMKNGMLFNDHFMRNPAPYFAEACREAGYARKTNSKTPWLLYDNLKDPYQLQNLISDSHHAELLARLDARSDELLALAGEPGDPVVYGKLIHEERKEHGVPDRWHELMPPGI